VVRSKFRCRYLCMIKSRGTHLCGESPPNASLLCSDGVYTIHCNPKGVGQWHEVHVNGTQSVVDPQLQLGSRAVRMSGGESRKSSQPFAVTKPKAPTKLCRTPSIPPGGCRSTTSAKNTNLKDLASFIVRNVLNNVTSEGKRWILLSSITMASSENAGDATDDNSSSTKV